jgi:glycosyltransferase A (GT-A) superfamily protein (DUF2064 family)
VNRFLTKKILKTDVSLFARTPVAGTVKKRLEKTEGPFNTLKIYATLLQNALYAARETAESCSGAELIWWYW